jgi:MFS family permease
MRWVSLLILCAIAAVGATSYSILSILVEPIKADLSLTDGEIGLITGLMIAVVGALAAFPIGAAADRFGRSLVLACCILTWSAATAVLAFASSKSVFALGVAGIILGEAALIPLLYAMIPAMFSDKQRPTANIVLVSVMVIGAYGVYAVLGTLLQTFEDWNTIPLAPWRGVCLVVALTGAAVTAALVMTPARKENAPKVGAGDLRDQSFLTYLKREGPTLFLFYLAISLYFVAFTQGIMFWSPAILQRSYGLSAAEANIALGTPLIAASAAGLALAYWLQRKLASRWGHAFGVRRTAGHLGMQRRHSDSRLDAVRSHSACVCCRAVAARRLHDAQHVRRASFASGLRTRQVSQSCDRAISAGGSGSAHRHSLGNRWIVGCVRQHR